MKRVNDTAGGLRRAGRAAWVVMWTAAVVLHVAAAPGAAASGVRAASDSVQCNEPAVTEDGHRFTVRCWRGPGTGFYVSVAVCGPGHCTRQGTNTVPYGEYATAWSPGFFGVNDYQAFPA